MRVTALLLGASTLLFTGAYASADCSTIKALELTIIKEPTEKSHSIDTAFLKETEKFRAYAKALDTAGYTSKATKALGPYSAELYCKDGELLKQVAYKPSGDKMQALYFKDDTPYIAISDMNYDGFDDIAQYFENGIVKYNHVLSGALFIDPNMNESWY